MALRQIREGILSSDRIELLDFPAEVFYRRLMSKVDDYGLYDARPSILRTSLYPLRVDRVREADIARWIAACEKAGVIALYDHGGKPYLQMLDTRWQARSEPKWPLPPWGKGERPPPAESSCKQPDSTAHSYDNDNDNEETPPPPKGGAFDRFWSEWPRHPRKAAKDQCRRKWLSKGCDAIADQVLCALSAAKASVMWSKQDGEFIPAPLTWLNQGRWEAPTEAELQADIKAQNWHESRSGIEAKGAELGIGVWDRDAWEKGRGGIDWATYSARVFKAAGITPRAA